MPFRVEEATAEDAAAIAKVFVSEETSDFLRLQLGTVSPSLLNEGMTERIKKAIEKRERVYIVARDEEIDEIVSYAQWELPRDTPDKTPDVRAQHVHAAMQHSSLTDVRKVLVKWMSSDSNLYLA